MKQFIHKYAYNKDFRWIEEQVVRSVYRKKIKCKFSRCSVPPWNDGTFFLGRNLVWFIEVFIHCNVFAQLLIGLRPSKTASSNLSAFTLPMPRVGFHFPINCWRPPTRKTRQLCTQFETKFYTACRLGEKKTEHGVVAHKTVVVQRTFTC